MSEEEIQYITTTKTTSRQNKKKKQLLLPPDDLYEMFPNIDNEIIEHCYKMEKGNFDRTISMLFAFQYESQPEQPKINNHEKDDLSQYILEFEKQEQKANSEQHNKELEDQMDNEEQMLQQLEMNRYDSLKAEVSSIWGDQPEFQQVLDDCDQYLSETDHGSNSYLDAIGVDQSHIPTDFVHKIQEFLLTIINEERQEFQNDFQEFPFLEELEGDNPYINRQQNQNQFLINVGTKEVNSKFISPQRSNKKSVQNHENQPLFTRLCEEFPYLSFSKIKYAFDQLLSYERCKIFLQKYYNDEYHPKEIKRLNNYQSQEQQLKTNQYTISDRYRKLSAYALNNLLQQNREKLKDLRSNYQVIDRCVGKYGRVSTNAKLNHFYDTQRIKIEQLEYEGIKIFVALIVAEQSFAKIDLHGFYAGEIEELLDDVIEQIKIYKTRLKRNNLDVEFVVGRGLHSKNRKAVIGPVALQYFRSCNYPIISQMEGRMIIKI